MQAKLNRCILVLAAGLALLASAQAVAAQPLNYYMGLPAGFAQAIVVAPSFADPNDPRNQSGPIRQPGQWQVTFVLQRLGHPLSPESEAGCQSL